MGEALNFCMLSALGCGTCTFLHLFIFTFRTLISCLFDHSNVYQIPGKVIGWYEKGSAGFVSPWERTQISSCVLNKRFFTRPSVYECSQWLRLNHVDFHRLRYGLLGPFLQDDPNSVCLTRILCGGDGVWEGHHVLWGISYFFFIHSLSFSLRTFFASLFWLAISWKTWGDVVDLFWNYKYCKFSNTITLCAVKWKFLTFLPPSDPFFDTDAIIVDKLLI